MKLEIRSYQSVGNLKFGMNIKDVSDILGDDYEVVDTFETSQTQQLARNFYPDVGVMVNFRRSGMLVAIELCKPADPVLNGKHVLRTSYRDLLEWLESQDPKLVVEFGQPTSFALGVAFYCIDYDDRIR